MYLSFCIMSKTFFINFEDGFEQVVLLPIFSAFKTFDSKFARLSIFHHLYFLNPIVFAMSLKHLLHESIPYIPIYPLVVPQNLQCFVCFPNFLSFGALCFMNFFNFAGLFFSCTITF